MNSFWLTIQKKPFVVLAPLADVTDAAFRAVIAKYGKPDVMWTEFVSADGLYHTRKLQGIPDTENPLMLDMQYGEAERPIVAQLFSSKPEYMEYGASVVAKLGFDGIDINMGCPHRPIEKQGAGAALIKNPKLARELIRAARRGCSNTLPVSVKTRVGYNKVELDTWLPELLEENPAVITLHARTRKEMSKVPAHWELVSEAVKMRDAHNSNTLIIGNGDVRNIEEAGLRAEESSVDGVMIGRGIFGNPWLWSEHTPSTEERLRVLVEHCHLFEQHCAHKSFAVMKKHFKAYVCDFDGASKLRAALMLTQNSEQVEDIIEESINALYY